MPLPAPRDWEGIMASTLDWVEFRRKGGDLGGEPTMGGIAWVGKFDTTLGDNGGRFNDALGDRDRSIIARPNRGVFGSPRHSKAKLGKI